MWVTGLLSVLVLLIGLRDTPRRPLPRLAVTPAVVGGLGLCVVARRSVGQAEIESAHVFVYGEQPDRRFARVAEGFTATNGRVCFESLPTGVTWVLADAPGTARASTQLVLSASRDVTLLLPPASTFEARVTDELGVPLPKATVLLSGSDPLPYGKLTGADGLARFDFVVAPPWQLRVHCAGYESAQRVGVSENVTVALRRLGELEVRVVTAQEKPVAGAAVLIVGSALWPARRARTETNGSATIRGLSAGSYDLQASFGDGISAPVIGFELARGAKETLTLRLEAGLRVTAWVTDGEAADAAAVADADVVLAEAGLGSFPQRGRTGRDGKVSLGPIYPGPATLGARHPDFVTGPLVAMPAAPSGPVRVALLRGATLRGDVEDARGRPIGGATIEVVGTDRFGLPIAETPQASQFRATHFAWSLQGPTALIPAGELGVMPGPVPPIPAAGTLLSGTSTLPLLASDPTEFQPWVSRDNGEFEARPVTPGRVRALVRHPAYVEAVSELVTLLPAGEARVRVVMLRGGDLEGRVVDERGFPVAGVDVSVVAERGTFSRSTITAADGAFAFAAVPQAVTISVARPEDAARVALKKSLEVPEGGRQNVELVIPSPRESVRIVVLDDRAEPVELAEVRVTSLELSAPLRSTLFTDASGAVELSDARGLTLSVVVDAPRFAKVARTFERAGAELKLTLDPGVLLVGQVTAVRGRRTVGGALVTLLAASERRSSMTDDEGNYRFASVPPGHVELTVTHADYADGAMSGDVERTTRSDRPFELPTIDLAEPGEVEGEVLDHRGQPQEGARVSQGPPLAYLPAGALPRGVAQTDARGHFVLRGLRPGTLRLSAVTAEGAQGSLDNVAVDSGRAARVVIRLGEAAAPVDQGLADGSVAITLGERGSGAALEVVVVQVPAASEAERGGLVNGDVLRAVDGQSVANMAQARARLAGRAGTDVLLDVVRGGGVVRLRVGREAVRR